MAAVLILVFTFMALEGLATLMAVILTCIGSTYRAPRDIIFLPTTEFFPVD